MGYLVGIKDLENENVYVDLNRESKEILKKKIRDKFKTYKNFSKHLNLKVDKLQRNNDLLHFFEGHKVKLKFLKKIISPFQELDNNFIETNLYRVGSRRGSSDIYNPKIPFNFNNKEGIRFISAILHDGGISSRLGVTYRNNNKRLRDAIIKCSKKIFGSFKENEVGTLIQFPTLIGIILKKVGLKEGKKVFTNPEVPKFIFESNKKNKALFLRQAFDDDGCVTKGNVRCIIICAHIDVTKEKRIPNLTKGIKKLLDEFDIKISGPYLTKEYKIKDNRRQGWSINIYGRKNLEIFQNKIGFDIKKKRDRLKNILESYKTGKYYLLKNQRYNKSLKKMFENLKGKYFTIKQASKIIDLDYHYTKQLIWKMEKEKLIGREPAKDRRTVNFFFK